jgi:hypothetical protein
MAQKVGFYKRPLLWSGIHGLKGEMDAPQWYRKKYSGHYVAL